MPEHVKHPPVSRPHRGNFAYKELSFLGAPCGLIREIVEAYIHARPQASLVYADADHHPENSPFPVGTQWMDHQTFSSIRQPAGMNEWQRRSLFQSTDGVLVNGNHFDASHQVALVHPEKLPSLQKRLKRLSDVQAVVLCPQITSWPDFLREAIPPETSTVTLEDTQALYALLDAHFLTPPAIHGLVLAGGKSQRMGQDKGLLNLHGKPQREYLVDVLKPFCETVHMSCRADQVQAVSAIAHPLPDRITDFGPLGALISAFMHNTNVAYLTVACDMPELGPEAIEYLLKHRDPSAIATAFVKDENAFPEPLCTLWEPKSYGAILNFLSQGNSCPRKVLINSDVKRVVPTDSSWVENLNTPEDLERWNHG